MNRRRFLAVGAALGTGGLAGCTLQSSTESPTRGAIDVGLDTVVEGLQFPTSMSFLPTGEMLVTERFGLVMRVTAEGLLERPFLDIRDRMAEIDGERGLLGIELHPSFERNRKFYLRYSAPTRPGMDESLSHVEMLAEFQATEDLTGIRPDSRRTILELPQPGRVHNAGDIAFGPDGLLYVPTGDGRRTDFGDEGWSWWYDKGQSAQNTTDNLLGGILRIDVDDRTDGRAYSIPSDNPLVGREGRDEYYAWGLRNPYRLSFDGDRLFVANVGEAIRESVYLVERGVNFGWPILEGSSCSSSTSLGHKLGTNPANAFNPKTWLAQVNRISPRKVCPTPSEADTTFTKPIVEYHRSGSRSITGGYVYRGDAVPQLRGKYVFGDFIPPAPMFATEAPDSGERPWPMQELSPTGPPDRQLGDGESIVSFARDPTGEVYVLTTRFAEGTGRVRQLVAPG